MEWYLYVAVVAAGFAAGFINTLAGSGSLITLPLLIFIGLPANVANGTNRVAILLQNVVGVRGYHREGVLDWRGGVKLVIPALIGAVIGAQIAVDVDETVLRHTIGGLMLVMLIPLFVQPRRWLAEHTTSVGRSHGWVQYLVFFAIGLYGGFIQAGVGIFLLAGLVLGAGYDLVRANAIKLFIVLCYTPLALAVFFWAGQVRWDVGLTLAVGNMLGAWVAVKIAVRKGAPFVRWILIGVVLVAGLKLLGVFDQALGLIW
ncbi:MAG TPA: sulfite exporter TauE/SafE family protein [Acidobacteriota bacterium]|nr:sulfite exporter TauE/SafE family protein [Acidobacteriota bacterium]